MTPRTFDFGLGPVAAHRHVNTKFGAAQVSGAARVFGAAWVLWGFAAPYHWTAWIDSDGDYQLAIGCEIAPVEWWPHFIEVVAPEHGLDADVQRPTLEALCAFVVAAFDRTHGGPK